MLSPQSVDLIFRERRQSTKYLLLLALATASLLFSGPFKLYPGAKLSATEGKTQKYVTPDNFAKVRAFYLTVGKEEELPPGDGKGWARAMFSCAGGETVALAHPPLTNDPVSDQTFIDVTRK
jgi:hypothetical protein